jgi:hypothetical protein
VEKTASDSRQKGRSKEQRLLIAPVVSSSVRSQSSLCTCWPRLQSRTRFPQTPAEQEVKLVLEVESRGNFGKAFLEKLCDPSPGRFLSRMFPLLACKESDPKRRCLPERIWSLNTSDSFSFPRGYIGIAQRLLTLVLLHSEAAATDIYGQAHEWPTELDRMSEVFRAFTLVGHACA